MKRILIILLILVLFSNTIYAGYGSDSQDDDNPLIGMGKDNLYVELTVDSTRGNSGIRYTTLGYFVDIYETTGEGVDKVQTHIDKIYIPEANFIVPGEEGLDTHRIPLYSMETGASIESLSYMAAVKFL